MNPPIKQFTEAKTIDSYNNSNTLDISKVKELLKKAEAGISLAESDFNSLDNNSSNLSPKEKELYEKAGDSKAIIEGLKSIIQNRSQAETPPLQLKSGSEYSLNNPNIENGKEIVSLDKELNNLITLNNANTKDNLGFSILEEKITLLFEKNNIITIEKKESLLLEYLLNNSEKLNIIIEKGLLSINGNCSLSTISPFEKKLKNKYKENKIGIVGKIVEGYTDKNGKKLDINEIFESETCKPIDLIKKLNGLKGPDGKILSDIQIKAILEGTASVKSIEAKDKINKLLISKGLTKEDLKEKNGKFFEEEKMNSFLNEKGFNEEEISKIKKELGIIKSTNIAKKVNVEQIGKTRKDLKTISSVLEYVQKDEQKYLNIINSLGIYNKSINKITEEILGDIKLFEALANKTNKTNSEIELYTILGSIVKINTGIKNTLGYNTNKEEKYINTLIKKADRQIVEEDKEKHPEKYNTPEKKAQEKRLQNIKYPINTETGEVTITENGKTDTIQLTQSERLLIDKNPETLANIVDFYRTLDKVGLKKLWSQKESLFKSIGKNIGIGFSIDSNYLNENEIKIFLNSVLKSVGEEKISPVFTLDSFLVKMETINKTQVGGSEAIVNTYYGETYLENKFFEKFVGRNNTIIGFDISKFEESLNGKKQENNFSFDTIINNYKNKI